MSLLVLKTFLKLQFVFFWLMTTVFFKCRHFRGEPKTILVLRTGALGDFLFAVPSFQSLRKRFPKAKIALVTTSTTQPTGYKQVVEYVGSGGLPWTTFVTPDLVDQVIPIPSSGLGAAITDLRSSVVLLRPELTFMLTHPGEPFMSLLRKLVFLRLIGVRGSVYGWRKRSTYSFLKGAQYRDGRIEHKVMGPLRCISESPLVTGTQDIHFDLRIEPWAKDWANEVWVEHDWFSKQVVAFAPGSIQPHKAWPIENYIAVGRVLLVNPNTRLVIVGTPADRLLGDELCRELGGRCINLAGTDLHQSAALLQRCSVLIGNDGGAMHLATAVSCPCITILSGIEYPGSVEPWFSKEGTVTNPVACAPCYSFTHCPADHNLCVRGIEPSDVLARMRSQDLRSSREVSN
jgi:heptosyltransferase II